MVLVTKVEIMKLDMCGWDDLKHCPGRRCAGIWKMVG